MKAAGEMSTAEMADILDECMDVLSGIRTIVIALGSEFQEQQALGVVAGDLGGVIGKIEAVRARLDPEAE